jgi:xanthine dehydrogenase YagS FAD-binding subunit
MAMALLAYDATIMTNRRSSLGIRDMLGDGSNGAADHLLAQGEMICSIRLPQPLAQERALYKRAIGRSHAEWPLAEVCARAVIMDGRFDFLRITAGGIAPVPLRLSASESVLLGAAANEESIAEAARRATADARPLPMTAYKLDLLSGLVRDVLERLAGWRDERAPPATRR